MTGRRTAVTMLLAVAMAALGACTTTPVSSFFALSPVPPTTTAPAGSGLTLALGPIDLPEYLDRPQIVTRAGDNRLSVDEFNRWGGPLAQEIGRVLAQQIGERLGADGIYRYPSRILADVDYRVALDFRRFDGTLGGEASLEVAWAVIDDRSGRVVDTRQTAYRAVSAGADYAGYAATLSRLLADLADELSAVLRGLRAVGPGP